MSKQYNTKLQERLEKFLKDENLSQAKAAPILGISQAALSQYRRSMYDKGDIEAVENKLKEFFQIQEEKTQNAQKAEPFRTKTSAGYIPTTISEEAYKLIRYCQLEKGIVVIDGDAGIGKTKAAAKFLQDNPSTTVEITICNEKKEVQLSIRLEEEEELSLAGAGRDGAEGAAQAVLKEAT